MNSSDNNTENEKWQRILVAACCVIIILGFGFLAWGLWNGFSSGTCGPDTIPLKYSTPIIPHFTMSFLHDFGESEPDLNLTPPLLHRYDERREIIDTLMDRAQMNAPPDSIIGLYESPDARLLLIDRNHGIVEILQAGNNIQIITLNSSIIGGRQYTVNETMNPRHGNYNYSYTNSISLEKVLLVFPPGENFTPLLYIVKKIDSERAMYPDGRLLDEITTRGVFYITYGQRVEHVAGNVSVMLDPEWKLCTSRMEITDEGIGIGEIKSTVKIARSSERMLRVRLIATSAYIQQYDVDMSSSNTWTSTDSTGCTC
ncbi:MAG: hypothetical protein Q7T80_17185 [Methanoregula sp.]|nr:hypothetical protein [Methanoregula sp.]